MSKLQKIKEELAKLLVKYSAVKTDNGILEYEGEELVAGMEVYITDENNERVAPSDGEYKTEDGKVITVTGGKVETIIDTQEEVEAEDEVNEEVKVEEQTEEEQTEEVKEEEEVKAEDTDTKIDEIRKEINELYKLVDSILEKIGETRKDADERLKKLECSSVAKPAVEEFETYSTARNTGDKKLDTFLKRFGN
jgi:ElaB/YqjD/DUF883 family membrane-anchored ribosome-binding protein